MSQMKKKILLFPVPWGQITFFSNCLLKYFLVINTYQTFDISLSSGKNIESFLSEMRYKLNIYFWDEKQMLKQNRPNKPLAVWKVYFSCRRSKYKSSQEENLKLQFSLQFAIITLATRTGFPALWTVFKATFWINILQLKIFLIALIVTNFWVYIFIAITRNDKSSCLRRK